MEAFDNAFNSFYDALPPVEQRRYVKGISPEELYQALEQLRSHAKQRQKSRISQSIGRITKVVKSLEQYFKAVDIIIQSNPEYAALVWGAIRFLLQLASNFSTFYDKLVITLERLAAEMSQYEGIAVLFKRQSASRLQGYLEKVYVQLFQFFHTAARIFLSNEKLRSTLSVLGDLVWKSFDDRFGEILERICSYRDLIKLELSLTNAKASNNTEKIAKEEARLAEEERSQAARARQRADEAAAITSEVRALLEQQRRDHLLDRITKWISAPHFAESPAHAQSVREDGTTRWIFDRAEYCNWKNNEWCARPGADEATVGENVLWIYGSPGSGKTVLAGSILQELQSQTRSSPRQTHEVCYYFFGSETAEPSTAIDAYRAVLTQLVHRHRADTDLLDKFSFILGGPSSTGSARASGEELEGLFRLCFQHLPVFLILDGLDECNETRSLLQSLLWLSTHTCTKSLLLSRANVPNMNRHIPQPYKFPMPRSEVSKDISIFLTSQLRDLVEEELLLGEIEVAELVRCLVQGADGMFLWAILMMKYLRSPALTPLERMRTIREVILPEGLDQMYHRISKLIEDSGKAQLDLAKKLMIWALCSLEPLPVELLHDALTFANSRLGGHKYQDFCETVSVISGGLLECYRPRENQMKESGLMVRYIHLSVKEHFLPGSSDVSPYPHLALRLPSEPAAHLDLAQQCMRYMLYFKPTMNRGKPNFDNVRPGCFAPYASRYWCQHITRAFVTEPKSPGNLGFEVIAISVLKETAGFVQDSIALQCWIDMYYSYCQEDLLSNDGKHYFAFCTHLLDYLHTCPPDSRLMGTLKDLLQVLRNWDSDISQLTKEWGVRLEKTPALIWNEVPAFISSRYFGSSLNTQVVSLGHGSHNKPGSSSKALCTISRTATDRHLTAVLTVWPSKAYEESWEVPGAYLGDYRKTEAEVSHGWIVTYELWNHEHSRQKVIDTSVQLCAREVSLLLRQSSRVKRDDDWGVSVPLAIGSRLSSFVILRTLYRCDMAENGPLDSIRSVVIPLGCHKELRSRWAPSFVTVPGDWYSYQFHFGLDDRYLVFTEEVRTSNMAPAYGGVFDDIFEKRTEPYAGRMYATSSKLTTAVYEIEERDDLRVRLQGAIQNEEPVTSAAVHHSRPILALSLRRSVNVWEFGSAHFTTLRHIFMANRDITDLEFSSCGGFLLVKDFESGSWSVKPLPIDLQCNSRSHYSPQEIAWQQQQTNESSVEIPRSQGAPNNYLSLRPGQFIQGPTFLSTVTNSSTSLLSSRSGTAVTIDISSAFATHPNPIPLVEITSLPEWAGMQHTSPTVIMPTQDRMSITVVLNKTSEDEYSISKPPDPRLPVVITRETSSIRRLAPDCSIANGTRMLLGTSQDQQHSGEHTGSQSGTNKRKRDIDDEGGHDSIVTA